jgi:hypothetical protein
MPKTSVKHTSRYVCEDVSERETFLKRGKPTLSMATTIRSAGNMNGLKGESPQA